jgi:DNA-binding NtrC family response regulator
MAIMRILVVDDNEELHFIIAVWLAKAGGFDLEFATDGDDAMKRYAERGPYDVVLTDFNHPGPDGLELAKSMRQKNSKQGVAMFTAGMSDSAVRSCKHLKIPILWKPCEGKALVPVLKAAKATKKTTAAKKKSANRRTARPAAH